MARPFVCAARFDAQEKADARGETALTNWVTGGPSQGANGEQGLRVAMLAVVLLCAASVRAQEQLPGQPAELSEHAGPSTEDQAAAANESAAQTATQPASAVDASIALARDHYAAGRISEAGRVLEEARQAHPGAAIVLSLWRRRLMEQARSTRPAFELHLDRNARVERRLRSRVRVSATGGDTPAHLRSQLESLGPQVTGAASMVGIFGTGVLAGLYLLLHGHVQAAENARCSPWGGGCAGHRRNGEAFMLVGEILAGVSALPLIIGIIWLAIVEPKHRRLGRALSFAEELSVSVDVEASDSGGALTLRGTF